LILKELDMAMAMVMVMVMIIHTIQAMIDIHTHLMYGVDDGSKDLKMTKEMLSICSSQGVSNIFMTPHINSSLSDQKLKEFKDKFNEISLIANSLGIDCHLGAEIYISFRLPNINFENHVMGASKVLLIEFSTFHQTSVLEHSYNLIKKGFNVIIAHVERYEYLSINDLIELKNMGALIQVNSSSLIKKGKSNHLKRAWDYIKNNLVDFVASDSHNTSSRPPNMIEAYNILAKKIGIKPTNDLFINNASRILLDFEI
jgi:protein-tyrosine phosphatase